MSGTVDLVVPLLARLPDEFTVDDLIGLLPDDVRRRQIAAALTTLVRAGSLAAIEDPDVARGRAQRRWRRRAGDENPQILQQTPPDASLLRSDVLDRTNTPTSSDVAAASNLPVPSERPFAGPLLTRNSKPAPRRKKAR